MPNTSPPRRLIQLIHHLQREHRADKQQSVRGSNKDCDGSLTFKQIPHSILLLTASQTHCDVMLDCLSTLLHSPPPSIFTTKTVPLAPFSASLLQIEFSADTAGNARKRPTQLQKMYAVYGQHMHNLTQALAESMMHARTDKQKHVGPHLRKQQNAPTRNFHSFFQFLACPSSSNCTEAKPAPWDLQDSFTRVCTSPCLQTTIVCSSRKVAYESSKKSTAVKHKCKAHPRPVTLTSHQGTRSLTRMACSPLLGTPGTCTASVNRAWLDEC